jgi:hypothetical protein
MLRKVIVLLSAVLLLVGCSSDSNGSENGEIAPDPDTTKSDTTDDTEDKPEDTSTDDTADPADTTDESDTDPEDTTELPEDSSISDGGGGETTDTTSPSETDAPDAVSDATSDTTGDGGSTAPPRLVTDFSNGKQGWSADISDYIKGMKSGLEFKSSLKSYPPNLSGSGEAFYLKSRNISDDSFMFLKRKIDSSFGLEPKTEYELQWQIEFASNAPSNCVGIGGPPGEAVYMKAGGSAVEPIVEYNDNSDRYHLNIDKSNQSSGGKNASVVGNIANGIGCEQSDGEYVRLNKSHVHPHPIRTDANGEMWLVFGTDSGFEGTTALYYLSVDIKFIKK